MTESLGGAVFRYEGGDMPERKWAALAGPPVMTVKVRMGIAIPSEVSVAVPFRYPLIVSESGLWWVITTMGAMTPNPMGFIPWRAIAVWASRSRRGRGEVQVQYLFDDGRVAVFTARGKPNEMARLGEVARGSLSAECVIVSE